MYYAQVSVPSGIPPYTVHQYLYSYFPQHCRDAPRPFLFRQAGGRCLILSRIRPSCDCTEFEIRAGKTYCMECLVVPTRKTRDAEGKLLEVPLRSNAERRGWLSGILGRFGGEVGFCLIFDRDKHEFRHGNGHLITYQPAQFKAMVFISDSAAFTEMMLRGLGRGKAFGYGLLYFPDLLTGGAHVETA